MALKFGRDGFLDPVQVDSAFTSINAARSGQRNRVPGPAHRARAGTPSRSLYFSMACGVALILVVIWGDDHAMSLLHRHVVDPVHDHLERRVARGRAGAVTPHQPRDNHEQHAAPWPPRIPVREQRQRSGLPYDGSAWPPTGQHLRQKTAVPPALARARSARLRFRETTLRRFVESTRATRR